jgi:hypothetical protein
MVKIQKENRLVSLSVTYNSAVYHSKSIQATMRLWAALRRARTRRAFLQSDWW